MRFIPKGAASTAGRAALIGEPEDAALDVGAALFRSQPVYARVWSGTSVLAPGQKTEKRELVDRILSPLARDEVGTIRCVGLNVSALSLVPP